MKKKFNQLIANRYINNIITLSLGSGSSQLILIISSIFFTRIYTPEQLGEYTIFLTVVSLLTPIINGRYDLSIVVMKTDEDAYDITIGALLVSIVFTFVISVVLIVLIEFSSIFNDIGYKILYVIPMIFIISIINILTSYNNRLSQYKIIASTVFLRTFIQSVLQILLGILSLGVNGLIVSQLISNIVGLKKQYNYIKRDLYTKKNIRLKRIFNLLSHEKNQLFYSASSIFISSLSYSIITFFISALYGSKEVGFYSISFRMLGLPIALISANVARVYFKEAIEEKKQRGTYFNLLLKTTKILSIISAPMFIIVMLSAESIFNVVFGFGWQRAGLFVKILSPMFALRFVVTSISQSLLINGKQKYELILQTAFLLQASIIYIISKIFLINIEMFLILVSIFFSLSYILFYLVIFIDSKSYNVRI